MGVKINNHSAKEALQRVMDADKLRLFLDYDGTLADFAPTPDEVYPDPELIDLLNRLNNIIDGDGKIVARVIVEGEPHYCIYRRSTGIKKGNILEIYDTIIK